MLLRSLEVVSLVLLATHLEALCDRARCESCHRRLLADGWGCDEEHGGEDRKDCMVSEAVHQVGSRLNSGMKPVMKYRYMGMLWVRLGMAVSVSRTFRVSSLSYGGFQRMMYANL